MPLDVQLLDNAHGKTPAIKSHQSGNQFISEIKVIDEPTLDRLLEILYFNHLLSEEDAKKMQFQPKTEKSQNSLRALNECPSAQDLWIELQNIIEILNKLLKQQKKGPSHDLKREMVIKGLTTRCSQIVEHCRRTFTEENLNKERENAQSLEDPLRTKKMDFCERNAAYSFLVQQFQIPGEEHSSLLRAYDSERLKSLAKKTAPKTNAPEAPKKGPPKTKKF